MSHDEPDADELEPVEEPDAEQRHGRGAWPAFFGFLAAVIVGLVVTLVVTLTGGHARSNSHNAAKPGPLVFHLHGMDAVRYQQYLADDRAHGITPQISEGAVSFVRPELCMAHPHPWSYASEIGDHLRGDGADFIDAAYWAEDQLHFIVNFCPDPAGHANAYGLSAQGMGITFP